MPLPAVLGSWPPSKLPASLERLLPSCSLLGGLGTFRPMGAQPPLQTQPLTDAALGLRRDLPSPPFSASGTLISCMGAESASAPVRAASATGVLMPVSDQKVAV